MAKTQAVIDVDPRFDPHSDEFDPDVVLPDNDHGCLLRRGRGHGCRFTHINGCDAVLLGVLGVVATLNNERIQYFP